MLPAVSAASVYKAKHVHSKGNEELIFYRKQKVIPQIYLQQSVVPSAVIAHLKISNLIVKLWEKSNVN